MWMWVMFESLVNALIPEKNKQTGGVEDLEIPGVIKKKSCGISKVLGFRP